MIFTYFLSLVWYLLFGVIKKLTFLKEIFPLIEILILFPLQFDYIFV